MLLAQQPAILVDHFFFAAYFLLIEKKISQKTEKNYEKKFIIKKSDSYF